MTRNFRSHVFYNLDRNKFWSLRRVLFVLAFTYIFQKYNSNQISARGTFRHAVKTIGLVEHHLVFPNSPQCLSNTSESKTLHIQNLSRPFTIEALKKILQKSGAILEESLWVDKIRTQCFVTVRTYIH